MYSIALFVLTASRQRIMCLCTGKSPFTKLYCLSSSSSFSVTCICVCASLHEWLISISPCTIVMWNEHIAYSLMCSGGISLCLYFAHDHTHHLVGFFVESNREIDWIFYHLHRRSIDRSVESGHFKEFTFYKLNASANWFPNWNRTICLSYNTNKPFCICRSLFFISFFLLLFLFIHKIQKLVIIAVSFMANLNNCEWSVPFLFRLYSFHKFVFVRIRPTNWEWKSEN